MNIVYALTRNLYKCLEPSLKSLLAYNKPRMVYILAEDDELPIEIPCPHKIINVRGQKYFKPNGPNMNSIFTYMVMMRLCYTELLKCDKVIQLDIDTIICDSLKPIWDIDLEGKWFSAVREYQGRYHPFRDEYYNIGVCVFNLKQMRQDNIVPTLIEELNKNYYVCVEQDALNKYGVPNKVVEMPIRFNECFCTGTTENPAIVHYAGIRDWWNHPTMKRKEYLDKWKNI